MSLLTGLGSLLGGLSNTKAARTGTSTQSYGTSSTGSTTPTFTTAQQGVQSAAADALAKEMNGGIDVTPLEQAGTGQINQTYKGIGDRLNESLSARGFGNSGASGTAALQTELGRAGAVGSLQSNLQSYALQQQQNALQMATQFGFSDPGTTTESGTSGSSAGTSTEPGSVAAGALSGGLTSLQAALNQAIASGAYA